MTKRLIEVDDDKLDAVRSLLGTQTLKATVDVAFNEILALAQRRRALLAEHGVDSEALGQGPDVPWSATTAKAAPRSRHTMMTSSPGSST